MIVGRVKGYKRVWIDVCEVFFFFVEPFGKTTLLQGHDLDGRVGFCGLCFETVDEFVEGKSVWSFVLMRLET